MSVADAAAPAAAPPREHPQAEAGRIRAVPPLPEAGDDELHGSGLTAFFINHLALFGDARPVAQVWAQARSAVRRKRSDEAAFNHQMEVLQGQLLREPTRSSRPDLAQLHGWDAEPLGTLLAEPGGLIVCGFHFGPYRHLPVDLALLGRTVTLPVNQTAEVDYCALFDRHLDRHTRPRIVMTCVGDRSSSIKLLRTLKRGGTVFAYIDGNSGTDGFTGAQNRVPVRFMGHTLHVKAGLARLAAATGAPLLPVLALPASDGPPRVLQGEPVRPGARLRAGAEEEFTRDAMQQLYGFLEAQFVAAPEQWENAEFVHRWRVPDRAPDTPGAADVQAQLDRGGRLRIRAERTVSIAGSAGPMLLDVRTSRGVRVPPWAAELGRALWSDDGVDAAWLAAHGVEDGGTMELLSELGRRALLSVEPV